MNGEDDGFIKTPVPYIHDLYRAEAEAGVLERIADLERRLAKLEAYF